METPVYRFRLPKSEQKLLVRMSSIYGAATPSAFIREMVMSMCSQDMGKAHAFIGRLMEKISGQQTLDFQQKAMAEIKAAQESAQMAILSPQEGKKAPKRGKGAKRDKRAT